MAVALFVVVVVMLVAMALLVVVVVMLVAVALFVVVVMVLVAVALFVVVVVMLVAMALFVVVVVMLVLFLERLYCILKSIALFHGGKYILTRKHIPRRYYYCSIGIVLTKKSNRFLYLMLLCALRMREDNGRRVGNLVVIELAEVLHIHLALINVSNRGKSVKHSVVRINILHRTDNVRKLTYSRGLNNNSVGRIFNEHLLKSLRKIADERTANATGIHLGYFNSRISEEPAVNSYLTEFVFDKHNLLSGVRFLYKLLYKSGFSGAEKA